MSAAGSRPRVLATDVTSDVGASLKVLVTLLADKARFRRRDGRSSDLRTEASNMLWLIFKIERCFENARGG